MRRFNNLTRVLVSAAVFATASSALASDGTIYPGEMCIQVGTLGVKGIYLGSTRNDSTTQTLTLDCPVVRQQTERGIDKGSWVRVLDRNTTKQVECILYAFNFEGVQTSSELKPSQGFGSQVQKLQFDTAVFADTTTHQFVRCTLPPVDNGQYSHIATYKIEENNG